MESHRELLAELQELRQATAGLLRAKLEALAGQINELASRTASDLGLVVPPDLETLLPLAPVAARLDKLAKLPPPAPPIDLGAVRRLAAGRAQSEVLHEFLNQLGPLCGARAIVVLREGTAAGWAGSGLPDADSVRHWTAAVSDSTALTHAADGTPALVELAADKVLGEWFGRTGRALLVPMSMRGRIVGILIAHEGPAKFDPTGVQIATFVVGLLLETLSTRQGAVAPALLDPATMAAIPSTPALELQDFTPPVFEPPVELPVHVSEQMPAAVPAAMFEPAMPVVSDVVPPPVAAPPPPPAPMPSVRPAPVVPPPVAVPTIAEDESKHQEARRFARLLVSEIRLYNEHAVQEGKVAHDIYSRLREDIERSREMYEQRVPAEIRARTNYFNDEMVRILADGNPEALGT
jgi:hypothetical protein